MKRAWRIISGIILFIVVVFGIPIGINEAYKVESGYHTLWGASDALSYYATVLGAIITAVSLYATIQFTKKQLYRDAFLENEKARWNKVEDIITQAIIDISPLKICSHPDLKSIDTEILYSKLLSLQDYVITSRRSLEAIPLYIDSENQKRIELLTNDIKKCVDDFCSIESEMETAYNAIIKQYNISHHLKKDQVEDFFITFCDLSSRIGVAIDGPYKALFVKKQETFEKIYSEIDEESKKILDFINKRKSKCHPLNGSEKSK